jgi:DNA-binding IclR family transcriptional regulator
MSLYKTHERLNTIDHHITTKAKGNMGVLGRKLGLSQSGTYKFLEEMKEEGFPIAYSKKDNQFYYTEKGSMIGYKFVRNQQEENPD